MPHTLVELWQCNAAGRYRHAKDNHPAPLDPNFTGAGRTITDAEGRYRFVTIKPGAYPWRNHDNAWRPAHIHFSLFGHSFATRLVTQMYFPNDPLFAYDPMFQSVRDPRAQQRLVSRFDLSLTEPDWALGYRFDIVAARARLDAVRGARMSEPQPRRPLIASASQTVGPFFHVGPGASDRCGVVAGPGVPGERIRLRIRVLDGDGAPVDDAMVEIRQADATGAYAPPPARPDDPPPAFAGFGRLQHVEGRRLLLRDDPPGRTRGRGRRGARHRVPVHARPAAPPLHARLLRGRSGARSRSDPVARAGRTPADAAGAAARATARPGTSSCGCRATTKRSSSMCEARVTARIVDALATTEALSAIFGDASALQALLDVEAALARAQAAARRDSGRRRRGDHAGRRRRRLRRRRAGARGPRVGDDRDPAGRRADRARRGDRSRRGALRPLGRHQPGHRRTRRCRC